MSEGSQGVDVEHEVEQLRRELATLADPERAAGEKAYLKSPLKFYGVGVPALRRISSRWSKPHRAEPVDIVARLAGRLWETEWHEEKSLAIMLLAARGKQLTRADLPLIERMMGEATTWAHLDEIALRLAGALIDNDPETLAALPRWAMSENFWVRRAAILAQIPQFRRGEGDLELFARLAVPMFDEGEGWSKEERFFIRKAIGWALRELSKAQPEWVADFAETHRTEMAGLSYREATRNLPDDLKARLDQ